MSENERQDARTLDEATAALRDAPIPDGPPQVLRDATVAALRRAENLQAKPSSDRRTTMRLAIKIAAVFVVGLIGFLAYQRLRPPVQQAPEVVVIPDRHRAPVPVPATAPGGAPTDNTLAHPGDAPARPIDTDVQHARVPVVPDPNRLPLRSPAADASIVGTVTFNGEAPEPKQVDMAAVKECAVHHPDGAFDEGLVVTDGRLANVVVWVKPADGQELPPRPVPATPAVLDQKGCQYRPHVVAVQVDQPLVVTNSDAFLHNVHALSIDNPAFNFGQPSKDLRGRSVGPMKVAEVFRVKCDVHPWMGAYVHVIDHPYFAVSGEDGTFAIPAGLPDGEYTLAAWHEKLGEKQAKVSVRGGKAEGVAFAFESEPVQ